MTGTVGFIVASAPVAGRSGAWIDRVRTRRPRTAIALDIDSSDGEGRVAELTQLRTVAITLPRKAKIGKKYRSCIASQADETDVR
jgi:hypothetical protein